MSFISRLIDKDKVKELTDKYKLIRPGFDDSHSLDSHMIAKRRWRNMRLSAVSARSIS